MNVYDVIRGLEACLTLKEVLVCDEGCPYYHEGKGFDCMNTLMRDAAILLREQEKAIKYQSDRLDELLEPQKPRLLTVDDFKDNPDVDICGYLPCWVEPNPHGDAATEKPGWGLVSVGQIGGIYHRHWTGKPTQEQMEATKWDG